MIARPMLTAIQQLYIKQATVIPDVVPSSFALTIWSRDVSDHETPCQSHFAGNGENLHKGVPVVLRLYSRLSWKHSRLRRSASSTRGLASSEVVPRFSELKIRSGDKQVTGHVASHRLWLLKYHSRFTTSSESMMIFVSR